MAAALNANTPKLKLSKSDAETIAEGEQISSDVGKRLRSSSGKIYHAGINFQTDNNEAKMGSIQEVIEAGGVDHAEDRIIENSISDGPEELSMENSMNQGIQQIISMVSNLQNTVNSMDQKVSAASAFQAKTETRLDNMEKNQSTSKQEIFHLNEQVQQYQIKVDILSDIVSKQHREIEELKAQMIDQQARGMKNNIIISGIPENPNENCLRKVNQFIVDKLLIKDQLIPIEQAYRFGTGRMRPMLVVLRHFKDKVKIFENVGNLKNQKVDGIQCFVASQLPEALNENRRRISECLTANKKVPIAKRLPYSAKKGELLFKNKPIEPRVWTPTPREMLKLTDAEMEHLNGIRLTEGVYEEHEESVFRSYATKVTDPSEAREAYKKLKLMHGEATHIACAYKFDKVQPPQNVGGCDDGEYGASRALQQVITEKGVSNVIVFMVRYYGGKKLGPLRFDLMKKTVESALTLWQVSLQDLPLGQADTWAQQTEDNEEEQQSGEE